MPGDVTQSPRFIWLEDLAFNGEPMPEGLRFPEQLLFLRLRTLYAYAKMIQMDPEQGRREKLEIVRDWEVHSAEHALLCAQNDRYRRIEAAASAIQKDPIYDQPKVRALMVALYGDTERRIHPNDQRTHGAAQEGTAAAP